MKAFLWYLVLVGGPVIGVLFALHVGQDLRPPVAVDGQWTWQPDAGAAGESTCHGALHWEGAPLLTISQSGPDLQISFNDSERTVLAGEIRELVITAAAGERRLWGAVDRGPEADEMTAELLVAGCAQPLRFTAVRQPPTGAPSPEP